MITERASARHPIPHSSRQIPGAPWDGPKGRVSSLQGKILQPLGSTIRNRAHRRLTGAPGSSISRTATARSGLRTPWRHSGKPAVQRRPRRAPRPVRWTHREISHTSTPVMMVLPTACAAPRSMAKPAACSRRRRVRRTGRGMSPPTCEGSRERRTRQVPAGTAGVRSSRPSRQPATGRHNRGVLTRVWPWRGRGRVRLSESCLNCCWRGICA